MSRNDLVHRRKGFTFVEVIIAIAIFSVVALGIYGTFVGWIELGTRFDKKYIVDRDIRWTFAQMTKDLENMRSYDFSFSYSKMRSFIGKKDEVSFLVTTKDGLRAVHYSLATPDSTKIHTVRVGKKHSMPQSIVVNYSQENRLYALVREEKSFVDYLNESTGKDTDEEVLTPRVALGGLKFLYPYKDEQDEKKIIWKDVWENDFLPLAVRIQLTLSEEEVSNHSSPYEQFVFIPTGFLGKSTVTTTTSQ